MVLLNNLGGTSNLEMGLLSNEIIEAVSERGWKIQVKACVTYLITFNIMHYL